MVPEEPEALVAESVAQAEPAAQEEPEALAVAQAEPEELVAEPVELEALVEPAEQEEPVVLAVVPEPVAEAQAAVVVSVQGRPLNQTVPSDSCCHQQMHMFYYLKQYI